jgi:LmbE family N-acetylglucosaminyl deacetylase
VTAHPDDLDVFFGGTVAILTNANKEVYVLVMTNGARGSRENNISENELAKRRIKEQSDALEVYGVTADHFSSLHYKDGEAENNMELIGKIAYIIRKFKPDLVVTHNPNYYYSKGIHNSHFHINHKDHRVCGLSAIDAVYPFSRDRSFFPSHSKEGLSPHVVTEILLTAGDKTNVVVDVTDVIKQKSEGLSKHESQFDDKKVDKILSFFKEKNKYFEKGFYINLDS